MKAIVEKCIAQEHTGSLKYWRQPSLVCKIPLNRDSNIVVNKTAIEYFVTSIALNIGHGFKCAWHFMVHTRVYKRRLLRKITRCQSIRWFYFCKGFLPLYDNLFILIKLAIHHVVFYEVEVLGSEYSVYLISFFNDITHHLSVESILM